MKEYTLLAAGAAVGVVILDARLGSRVLRRGLYWIFLGLMFFMKFLMNGFLTGQQIVEYGQRFFLGVRVGSIPVEDFVYGFALITMTISLWEYYRRRGDL